MSQRNHFFLEWMLLNPIGFTLGSLYGATDHGFIPSAIPGTTGLVLGDLIFGMIVGFVQYIVFRRTGFLPASSRWIIASSLGFTLGARIGALLTFRITDEWVLAGIVFGAFMGGCIGLATAFALFRNITPKYSLSWLATCTLAWITGESIAFATSFSLLSVPLVALAIAGITGLGLIYLQPHLPAERS
jgi:hypothetical protein